MTPSRHLLRLAEKLDRPGYPWYVRALDWLAGRLADAGL
jgi:hypothetical protein